MKIVVVAGSSSNVGKTTLACELLRRLPGWEAVKVTKGHYRSCGKDPHACCVSHLLGEHPLVVSERKQTDVPGKDTGRYWAAGASKVHWVVATKDGVESGVREAMARADPEAGGIVLEATSVLGWLEADLALMTIGASPRELKPSAARVLAKASYLFAGGVPAGDTRPVEALNSLLAARGVAIDLPPVLYDADVDRVAHELRA